MYLHIEFIHSVFVASQAKPIIVHRIPKKPTECACTVREFSKSHICVLRAANNGDSNIQHTTNRTNMIPAMHPT